MTTPNATPRTDEIAKQLMSKNLQSLYKLSDKCAEDVSAIPTSLTLKEWLENAGSLIGAAMLDYAEPMTRQLETELNLERNVSEARAKALRKAQAECAAKDLALRKFKELYPNSPHILKICDKAISSTAGKELLTELNDYKENLQIQRDEIATLRTRQEELMGIAEELSDEAEESAEMLNRCREHFADAEMFHWGRDCKAHISGLKQALAKLTAFKEGK